MNPPFPPNPPTNPSTGFSAHSEFAPPDPYAAAKWASVWQFVIGGLGAMLGMCLGSMFHIVPMGKIIAQSGQQLPLPEGITTDQFLLLVKVAYTVIGIALFIGSACLIGLGLAVRRASKGGTIASVVIVSIALFVMLLFVIQGIVMAFSRPLEAVMTLAMLAVPVALVGFLVFALVRSLKSISKIPQIGVQRQQWLAWQQAQQPATPQSQAAPWSYGPPTPQAPQQNLTPPAPPPQT